MRMAARTHLPPAARPVRYLVLAEFPRTSSGKIARATLRSQVTAPGTTPALVLGAVARSANVRGAVAHSAIHDLA
jgi:hypothetical protein